MAICACGLFNIPKFPISGMIMLYRSEISWWRWKNPRIPILKLLLHWPTAIIWPSQKIPIPHYKFYLFALFQLPGNWPLVESWIFELASLPGSNFVIFKISSSIFVTSKRSRFTFRSPNYLIFPSTTFRFLSIFCLFLLFHT
jgi:hypothetical protein